MAIHEINDKIVMNNGENLEYAARKKKQILEMFHAARKGLSRALIMMEFRGMMRSTRSITRGLGICRLLLPI